MDLDRALLQLVNGNAIRLPPYPATALKLSRVLQDPAHHQRQVIDVVKADAPFTAAVMRVANSAMWAGYGEATTLPAAIGRVGELELSRLALAAGLAGTLNVSGPLGRISRRAWHDSVAAATCAALIAPSLGLDRDELFVAGLLHDIGRMVAVRALEDLLRQRPSEPSRSVFEWASIIDRYHVELGLLLARSWQLPEVFVDAISQHHQPSPTGRWAPQIRALAAVDQLVDVLNSGIPLTPSVLALLAMGLEPPALAQLTTDLAQAPAMIAGFEDPHGDDRDSKVTRVHTPMEVVAPVAPMIVKLPNGAQAPCWSARATEVAFTSPKPMPESFLQRVEITSGARRIPLWLRIAAMTPTAGGYAVVGQPFALAGQALSDWLGATQDGASLV